MWKVQVGHHILPTRSRHSEQHLADQDLQDDQHACAQPEAGIPMGTKHFSGIGFRPVRIVCQPYIVPQKDDSSALILVGF